MPAHGLLVEAGQVGIALHDLADAAAVELVLQPASLVAAAADRP